VTGLLLLGCAAALGAGKAAEKPESRVLRHGELDRTYVIQTPKETGRGKCPVILLLHPSACTGQIVWEQTSLPRIARENGVILAAPDGINKIWNTHWWKGGVDDVGFLTKVLDEILARDHGDPERIYVTGMSGGAGMTVSLAWTIGNRLAAIGPVANNLGGEERRQPTRLTRPLPVIHIMGTADLSVPYAGGLVFNLWPVLSADQTIAYWVQHNGCRTDPAVEALEDVNKADRSHVVKMTYRGGREGAEVVHLRIEGGGHTWPGGPASALGELFLGTTNRDIDSGTVLWEFFKDKRRVADSPRVERR
jgi:polyhydroxybutyrate depolymerase